MAAKIADRVSELAAAKPPETEQLTDEQLLAEFFGPDEQPPEPQPYGQPQPQYPPEVVQQIQGLMNQGLTEDQAVAQLQQQASQDQAQGTTDPRMDQIIDYLADREERENTAQLNDYAKAHPELKENAEIRAEVIARVQELAERAGDPGLRTDLSFVRTAHQAVMTERSQVAGVPMSEARNQGAPLETDAGASVEGGPSDEDQWWNSVKGAGGQAFPT